MPDFQLPLPDKIYRDLREEAERSSRPATVLARQAIRSWLRRRRKIARHEAVAAFAAEHAGSPLDLDVTLEAESVDNLILTKEAQL